MAEHKIPAGITRVSKGLYRTLDGLHEIRQEGKVWEVTELATGHQVGGQFSSRGLAVQALAEAGKLTTEAPSKVEVAERFAAEEAGRAEPDPTSKPKAKPRPTRRQPKAKATATA
jgi:hypothetical protein